MEERSYGITSKTSTRKMVEHTEMPLDYAWFPNRSMNMFSLHPIPRWELTWLHRHAYMYMHGHHFTEYVYAMHIVRPFIVPVGSQHIVAKAFPLTGGPEVEESARFVETFDKFFDALNVNNFSVGHIERDKQRECSRSRKSGNWIITKLHVIILQ